MADNGDGIAQRLSEINQRFSQAEIARRTNTSTNNVSRYMRGGKIPLEFGAALVTGLGVNPAWLLSGEGAAWLADVPRPTADMATDILKVVEAMNAVMKLRLGSLVGKEHAKILRQLNEAMLDYEKLRGRLEGQVEPVLRQLFESIDRAYAQGRIKQAEDLTEAAGQLLRFCEAGELHQSFVRFQLLLASRRGQFERVIELQRERYQTVMANPSISHQVFFGATQDLLFSLGNVGFRAEASRICRAALVLLEDKRETFEYWILNYWSGELDCYLGAIRSGVSKMIESHARFNPRLAANSRHRQLFWLLMSGSATLAEAIARLEDESESPAETFKLEGLSYITSFATWAEDSKALRRLCARWELHGVEVVKPSENMGYTHATCVRDALENPRAKAYQAFLDASAVRANLTSAVPVFRLSAHIYATQVARLCGQTSAAHDMLEQADQMLESLPQGVVADVLDRGIHYRNALGLLRPQQRSASRKALRAHAQRFFREYRDAGYACYREVVANLEGA